MKILSALASVLIVLLLMLFPVGAIGAGRDSKMGRDSLAAAALDPGFGSGGLAEFPAGPELAKGSENSIAALGAAGENGSLVVSDGSSVDLLSDSGQAGAMFGGVGSLSLPAAAGREFKLDAFIVDPHGRLIVVGSSPYPEVENASPLRGGTPTFIPAELRILRFLPRGNLDRSFGSDGVLETDLGLPAPLSADGRRRLGAHPAVRATGISLGPAGEIIVTGDAVVRLGRDCVPKTIPPAVVKAGFVFKMSEDGAPDRTFGKEGLVGGRRLDELPLGGEVIREPVVSPTGVVTFRSSSRYACAGSRSQVGLGQITKAGQARKSFGRDGASAGQYTAIAGGSDGSVVTMVSGRRRKGDRVTSKLSKFAPDGRRIKSFGTHGVGLVKLGSEPYLNALAVDSQGRILVSGTTGLGATRSMVLVRLTQEGQQQINFGPGGRIIDRVPGLADSSSLFFDSAGRLIAVHAGSPNKGLDLVVARYLMSDSIGRP